MQQVLYEQLPEGAQIDGRRRDSREKGFQQGERVSAANALCVAMVNLSTVQKGSKELQTLVIAWLKQEQ